MALAVIASQRAALTGADDKYHTVTKQWPMTYIDKNNGGMRMYLDELNVSNTTNKVTEKWVSEANFYLKQAEYQKVRETNMKKKAAKAAKDAKKNKKNVAKTVRKKPAMSPEVRKKPARAT